MGNAYSENTLTESQLEKVKKYEDLNQQRREKSLSQLRQWEEDIKQKNRSRSKVHIDPQYIDKLKKWAEEELPKLSKQKHKEQITRELKVIENKIVQIREQNLVLQMQVKQEMEKFGTTNDNNGMKILSSIPELDEQYCFTEDSFIVKITNHKTAFNSLFGQVLEQCKRVKELKIMYLRLKEQLNKLQF